MLTALLDRIPGIRNPQISRRFSCIGYLFSYFPNLSSPQMMRFDDDATIALPENL